MVDSDRMTQIEEGLRDAARSTTDLRLSVESLSAVAGEVAGLQRAQAETDRKAQAADDKATEVDRVTSARIFRQKRVGSLVAFGIILLLLVASFLTFRAAVVYIQDLTQRVEQRAARADALDRETRYASCVVRNKAVQAQADRETRLAGLAGISKAEAAIHANSATELGRLALAVDCERVRKAP